MLLVLFLKNAARQPTCQLPKEKAPNTLPYSGQPKMAQNIQAGSTEKPEWNTVGLKRRLWNGTRPIAEALLGSFKNLSRCKKGRDGGARGTSFSCVNSRLALSRPSHTLLGSSPRPAGAQAALIYPQALNRYSGREASPLPYLERHGGAMRKRHQPF